MQKNTRILWADPKATEQPEIYSRLANEFGILMLVGTSSRLIDRLVFHGKRLDAIIISAPLPLNEESSLKREYQRLRVEFKGLPRTAISLNLPFLAQTANAFCPQLPVIIFADIKDSEIEKIRKEIDKNLLVVKRSDGIDALIKAINQVIKQKEPA